MIFFFTQLNHSGAAIEAGACEGDHVGAGGRLCAKDAVALRGGADQTCVNFFEDGGAVEKEAFGAVMDSCFGIGIDAVFGAIAQAWAQPCAAIEPVPETKEQQG